MKFRGKSINGDWDMGNLSVLTQKVNHVEIGTYISNSVGLPFAYMVRPETVGQYIERKDINGKEIYVGDIVKASFKLLNIGMNTKIIEESMVGEVIYDNFECAYKIKTKKGYYLSFSIYDKIEIIGNVFKNVE